jgi:hypothetical protein
METNPRPFAASTRVAIGITMMMVIAGRAEAQTPPHKAPKVKAQPLKAYPLLGDQLRGGDYFAVEPGALFWLGPVGESRRPVGAIVRGELGVGGAGGGAGLAIDWFQCEPNPYPNPVELMCSMLTMLEARAERMYGPSRWNHTTYVGPQISLDLWWRLSVGWMVDVHDRRDNHLQVGVGVGF